MLRYNQILDRLFSAVSVGSGLSNARVFDQALGNPTAAYPTVHIAGTNGKGSVATKIAKALELSGRRVGLYTSPHLTSFCERITVNGQMISENHVIEGMEKIFSIDREHRLNASFFEMATFLAFEYFRNAKVDIAVIETGLGGRLDATNIITPILSVITSISREHTHILGEDVEQIASEKAGILKEKVPVVLGPKARCQAIYSRAQELQCPVFASKKISYFYDEENSAVAELALAQLQLGTKSFEQALSIRPPCRFERHGDLVFDVAHNPEAIFYLIQALHHFFPESRFRFLVGFSKDKEYDQCLELIAAVASHIHFVQAATPRAATVEELRAALKDEDPAFCTSHSSIKDGVEEAYTEAVSQSEILVICGSFYIMAEAKLAAIQFSSAQSTVLSSSFT
jgi:dihydrofolate synthase/folylpolyglutamate synthase